MKDLGQRGRHPKLTDGGSQAAGQRVLRQPAGHQRGVQHAGAQCAGMEGVARPPAQVSQLRQGWARVCNDGVQRSLLGQEAHAEGSTQAPRAHSCSVGAGWGLLLGAHGKQQQGLGSVIVPQVGQEVCGQAPKAGLVVDKALEALRAQHLARKSARKQHKTQLGSTVGS